MPSVKHPAILSRAIQAYLNYSHDDCICDMVAGFGAPDLARLLWRDDLHVECFARGNPVWMANGYGRHPFLYWRCWVGDLVCGAQVAYMQLMRLIAVSFLLAVVSIPALASSKNVEYTDAVLVSFKNIDAGISCEADTLQKDKENCYNRSSRSYTLKTQGDGLMVVVFGYNFLNRYNVLANQMPGTHVQIRSDKRGFYVRIGDHEGRYDIVEAQ